ncbi:MAG: hypothetical protein Q7K34_03140, partial [archaeon]|nr:hypothetical protein [archaeon]
IEEINANIEAIRGELELKRRYKAEWESFFSTLRLNVSRDKTLSNEFEKINKMVDETKLRAKNAFAKKRRRLGLLRQSWKLGAYNSRPEYQRQIDNAILEYAKAGIDLAKAQEDLWIFWHRVAVKSPASNPPPHMLEELARRRHNSTGHKNSLQMLITKLSTK